MNPNETTLGQFFENLEPAKLRECTKCKEHKPLSEFHNGTRGKTWVALMGRCKTCHAKMVAETTAVKANRDAPPKDHKCPICECNLEQLGRQNKWSCDHVHGTTQFRGWLCPECNMGLGKFKDNYENLLRAAEYVLAHECEYKEAKLDPQFFEKDN